MPVQYQKGILIAFGELFLKSEGVQKIFRRRLEQNLSFFLRKSGLSFKILSFRERILIEIPENSAGVRPLPAGRGRTPASSKFIKAIKNVFGVAWFAECFFFPGADLKELGAFVDKNYKDWIKRGETFAIRLKAAAGLNKGKIIERIAKNVDRKVNLNNPKKEIFVEIRGSVWFLYFKKQKGTSGLPSGASGKVLTLMSGGIDSPVAAYLVAKRGAENVWLHFHSFPLVSNKSVEKTKELAKIFLKYQPRLKVYFVPFSKGQMEIKAKTPAQYRILLYRRLMLRIAEIIARKEKYQALVTGESLGQVSSQTLPNLKIIGEAVKTPILRPLIGMDKEEIIKLAKKIGTFSVSIKPQEDCCTLFTPKHPTAEGKIEEIKKIEEKLNIKRMIEEIIRGIKVEIY